MVLEATIVLLDNSEFSRNGDYPPTRYESELDVVELIFNKKTRDNPENTVGVISYAGSSGNKILSTLTSDLGKILSGVHNLKIEGKLNFLTGIQVAALALKHRQNKVQHQRIISFVCSPIEESEKDLEKLAKKMKKNNISVDFINFGEDSTNTEKLDKFISILNNSNSNSSNNNEDISRLVTIPPPTDGKTLFDLVRQSNLFGDDSNSSGNQQEEFGFGNNDGFEGFAEEMDPDLALALRLSLEEEQARQRQVNEMERIDE